MDIDTPGSEEVDKPNRLTQFLHEQAIAAKKREDELEDGEDLT